MNKKKSELITIGLLKSFRDGTSKIAGRVGTEKRSASYCAMKNTPVK
jgi:hypothetical protein